jgi:beta-lactamase class A
MKQPDPRRRALLQVSLSAAVLAASAPARSALASAEASLTALEQRAGGRLGVFALEHGTGRRLEWRADERFGLCSTFKLLLAASVLREADAGRMDLDAVLPYGPRDMVPHAPVTQRHLARGGMRIIELAEATQTTSDNVAANLLIRALGGPERVTALFRQLGDATTRIDRFEPEMNFVPPGEVRDTTTPRAIATALQGLMTGTALSVASRDRLRDWMIATGTGMKRIRAGIPPDWIAGDKTGTASAQGMPDKCNDVAALWPAGGGPAIFVAAYYEAQEHAGSIRLEDEAVLADVGRIVARWAVG